MNDGLETLRERLGEGRVSLAPEDRRPRTIDLWPQALGWPPGELDRRLPSAVLTPRTEEEAAACLAWAAERGAALTVRGAGSGVVGAAVPEPGALVLDCSELTRRFAILEGPEPVVSVSAGMRGGELERRLNALGWSLCHQPQSLEDSSVGGWIGHDGFGQLSTRYGGVRRQLRAVRVAGLGGAIRASSADAQAGAEGTLGVITEATFLIRPKPAGRRFFAWAFGGLDEAAAFARRLAAAPPPPSALRAYSPVDRLVHSVSHGGGRSRLKERLEAALLGRTAWLYALAPLAGRRWTLIAVYENEPPFGDLVPGAVTSAKPIGEAAAKGWWERRFKPDASRLRRLFENGCFADTVDLCAPYPRLAAVEREVREAVEPHAFAFAHLSHFDPQGACLYVTLAGGGGPAAHAAAWSAALEACLRAGGTVNHHHGVGRAKKPWLANAVAAERLGAWRREKAIVDPRGLLNPGLLCP
ncbi:MAG: FAD-binding oxidoreductase [Elusimicrobia bacterium]|nr:FAD-binding oxidoreductase [Elusimicrobiota bacterium]